MRSVDHGEEGESGAAEKRAAADRRQAPRVGLAGVAHRAWPTFATGHPGAENKRNIKTLRSHKTRKRTASRGRAGIVVEASPDRPPAAPKRLLPRLVPANLSLHAGPRVSCNFKRPRFSEDLRIAIYEPERPLADEASTISAPSRAGYSTYAGLAAAWDRNVRRHLRHLPPPRRLPAGRAWESRAILQAFDLQAPPVRRIGRRPAHGAPASRYPQRADLKTISSDHNRQMTGRYRTALWSGGRWLGRRFNGRTVFPVADALKLARDQLAISPPRKTA